MGQPPEQADFRRSYGTIELLHLLKNPNISYVYTWFSLTTKKCPQLKTIHFFYRFFIRLSTYIVVIVCVQEESIKIISNECILYSAQLSMPHKKTNNIERRSRRVLSSKLNCNLVLGIPTSKNFFRLFWNVVVFHHNFQSFTINLHWASFYFFVV